MRAVSLLTITQPLTLDIDTMPRPRLLEALQNSGVEVNTSAGILLDDAVFDDPRLQHPTVVERSVSELGLADGASLSQIFEAAQACGLRLCPPTMGPYLRLALHSQKTAPDAIMSNGQAPSGSLTVASAPLRPDADYPKGFYLRVISGQSWLRGYRSDDEHVWNPADRFVFRT